MADANNTLKSIPPDVLAAYADDVVALDRLVAQLQAALDVTRKALDVALAESAALADDRDAWREAHSVTLRLLHEATRANERLTAQLRKQQQTAPR